MISIVIIVTFILSLVSISLTAYKVKRSGQNILKPLLLVVVSLNSIWYSVIILQLWNSEIFSVDDSIVSMGLEILFSSILFATRFLFLIAFINLLIKILGLRILKSVSLVFKTSVIIVFGIWVFGWLELLVFDSNGIINHVVAYTDILIIFSVIIGSIYMIFQSALIQNKKSRNSIKTLGLVFVVPMVLGFIKWLLSGSFDDENEFWERLSLHILVILFNALFIWWLLFYGKKLDISSIFENNKKKHEPHELILKYNISKREMEVIYLICEGYTNKQIAEKLFISIDTVKDHNSRIFQKTGVKNRTQLAKLFIK